MALLAFTVMLGTAGRMLEPRPDPSLPADDASKGLSIGDHAIDDANRREMPRPNLGPSAIRAHGPSRGRETAPRDVDSGQAFRGTVVREGSDYMLRDATGEEYRLDAVSSAQAYEGRPVKVNGQLEESARLIHVQEIEEPDSGVTGAAPAP